MAKTASLVLIDREMLIEEQQLPERADLPLAVERGMFDLAESIGLNSIDVGNDPRHILVEGRRHLTAEIARSLCLAGNGCTNLRSNC
jgi:hypothetical protein